MKKFFFFLIFFFLSTKIFPANLNYLLDIKYKDFPEEKYVRIVLYFTIPPIFQDIKTIDNNKLEITLYDTDKKNFIGNLKVPSVIIDEISTVQKKKDVVVLIKFKSNISKYTAIKSKKPPLLYLKVIVTGISKQDNLTSSQQVSEKSENIKKVKKLDNKTIKRLQEIKKRTKDNKSAIVKKEKIKVEKVKKIVTQAEINEARNYYEQGLSFMAERKYSEAMDIFNYIIATTSKENIYNIKSKFRIIDCNYYLIDKKNPREYMDVLRAYQSLVAEYPKIDEASWAAFQMANCYKSLGFYEEALGTYKYVTKYFPKSIFALKSFVEISDIYYKMKKYNKALTNYRKILEKYPDSILAIKANYYIGSCLYYLKKYKEALKVYKEALQKDPKFADSDPDILYSIGNAYFYVKDYIKAREFFLKVRNLYPKSSYFDIALLKIGETYASEKDYKSACYVFKRVIDVSKNSDHIIVARLEMADLGRAGKIKDKNLFKKYSQYLIPDIAYKYIIDNFPNHKLTQIAFSRLVNYLLKNKDYKKSVSYLEEFFKRFPFSKIKENMQKKFYPALYGYIKDLFKGKEYEKIIYYYEKYNKSYLKDYKPKDIFKKIYFSYKNLYLFSSSDNILKKLAKKYKNDEVIKFEIISNGIIQKDFKNTLKEIALFNKKFPKSKRKNMVIFYEGLCYENLNIYDKAIDLFYKALKGEDKNKGKIFYHLAECYRQSGKYSYAEKFYDDIINNFDDRSVGKDILKNSYFEKGYVKYLLKKFSNAVKSFKDYKTLYSDAENIDEVNYYILNSLYNQSKYDEALQFFKNNEKLFKNKNFLKLSKEIIDEINWVKSFK